MEDLLNKRIFTLEEFVDKHIKLYEIIKEHESGSLFEENDCFFSIMYPTRVMDGCWKTLPIELWFIIKKQFLIKCEKDFRKRFNKLWNPKNNEVLERLIKITDTKDLRKVKKLIICDKDYTFED